MKLLIAIVHKEDSGNLVDVLIAEKYQVTKLDSVGGFLREKNVTIMLGLENKKVPDVLKIIKKNCRTRTEYITPAPQTTQPGELFVPNPVEVKVGGATVFILKIDEFKQI